MLAKDSIYSAQHIRISRILVSIIKYTLLAARRVISKRKIPANKRIGSFRTASAYQSHMD